jgi:hypothetical protein
MKKEREFRVGDKVMYDGRKELVYENCSSDGEVYLVNIGNIESSECTLIPTHEDVVEAFEGSECTYLEWNHKEGYRWIMQDGLTFETPRDAEDAYNFFMKNQVDPEKEALKAEKAELEKKLAEINEKLGE